MIDEVRGSARQVRLAGVALLLVLAAALLPCWSGPLWPPLPHGSPPFEPTAPVQVLTVSLVVTSQTMAGSCWTRSAISAPQSRVRSSSHLNLVRTSSHLR